MRQAETSPRRILLLANSSLEQNTGRLMAALAARLGERHEARLRLRPMRRGLFGRAAAILVPSLAAARAITRADILVVHSMVSLAAPHVLFARLLRKRVVVFLWDIYPDAITEAGRPLPRFAASLLGWIERRVLGAADRVLVPSADYLAHPTVARIRQTEVFPLWLPQGEAAISPSAAMPGGALRIGVAGQINPLRDIAAAAAALAQAAAGPVELNIFSRDPFPSPGAAPLPGSVRVTHHGFLAPDRLRTAFAALDAGLVSLTPRFTLPAFPSKILTYVAAGLPVIYHGPNAPALEALLERTGVGFSLRSGGASGLSERIAVIRSGFAARQTAFFRETGLDWGRLEGIL